VAGSYYLVADFGVQCADSQHKLNVVFASLVLFALGAGLPCSIVGIFKRYEHAHEHRQISFLVGKSYCYSLILCISHSPLQLHIDTPVAGGRQW
jgi:hypothetical protein